MTLKEYQDKYGIKRIDFNKMKKSGLELRYASGKMICPYCETEMGIDCEEYDDVISGSAFQCPECEKWFYVTGEYSIDTTCWPMEDAVLYDRKHIERSYEHVDECEKAGMEFEEGRYGNVEWEMYMSYAKPLFENEGIGHD